MVADKKSGNKNVLQDLFNEQLQYDRKKRCEDIDVNICCKREKFLSRLFGIFNEEVVDAWCCNENSPYKNLGRPSIYDQDKKYLNTTLDFTFEDKNGGKYIVEMKAELQYQKFKYMILDNASDTEFLKNHLKKQAFKLFVNPGDNIVQVDGKNIKPNGSILVWGSIKEGFNKKKFCKDMSSQNNPTVINFHEILSVENMISDLIQWKDENYQNLISMYQGWSDELYDGLRK